MLLGNRSCAARKLRVVGRTDLPEGLCPTFLSQVANMQSQSRSDTKVLSSDRSWSALSRHRSRLVELLDVRLERIVSASPTDPFTVFAQHRESTASHTCGCIKADLDTTVHTEPFEREDGTSAREESAEK